MADLGGDLHTYKLISNFYTNTFISTQRTLLQITYFTYSTELTILTIWYLSYLQNSVYNTYNTQYTKLPIHALLDNTVLKQTTWQNIKLLFF